MSAVLPFAHVSVNGETHAVQDGTSVAELLRRLGHEPESVAVAVNGDFVARAHRGTHVLRHGDRVACFKAIVGG